MSPAAVLAALEMGDLGVVEFFELALDAGLSLEEIGDALEKADIE